MQRKLDNTCGIKIKAENVWKPFFAQYETTFIILYVSFLYLFIFLNFNQNYKRNNAKPINTHTKYVPEV